MREAVVNQLLSKAGIPMGAEFTYSQDLHNTCFQQADSVLDSVAFYINATSLESREKNLATLLGKIDNAAGALMQRFLRDNADEKVADNYYSTRLERQQDPLHLDQLGIQMEIVGAVASGDDAAAMETARRLVREKEFGLDPSADVSPQTKAIIESVAKNYFDLCKNMLYPLIADKISDYNTTGFEQSFNNAAMSTIEFAGDVITTPFDERSRDKLAKGFEPIIFYGGRGELGKLAPLVSGLAQTAFHVTLERGQVFDLAQTIAGSVAFEVMLSLASAGAGSALGSAEKAGKITQNTAKVMRTAGKTMRHINTWVGKKAVNPAFALGGTLTLDGLNKNISNRVDSLTS